MKVHVTGGTGFLGGRVIPLLRDRGHEVSALARSPAASDKAERMGATAVAGDLDDPASIHAAFGASGGEALVNLASLGFGHAGTIVAAAEEAGLSRAVFVSSTSIFTRLNAASKAVRTEAERVIRASGLDWTIVRPTMIYGAPGDRNMARLLRLLRRSPVVPVPGGGHRLQQPVHVDDVAAAVVAALDAPSSVGRSYDVAGPSALSLRELVLDAGAAVGRRPALVPLPIAPLTVALRLYESAVPRPRLKAEQVERLAEDKAFDIGAARRDLGYDPRSFADGIRQEAALLA